MDKKLTGLMSIFLLSFALFLSLVFLNKNVGRSTRASSTSKPSVDTSFILAYPLEQPAGSKEPSMLTIFVRGADTKPLVNKTVTLTTNLGVIQPPSVVTDNDGKAVAQFTCSSTGQTSGVAQIRAIIDNTLEMTKTVSIKCD